MNTNMTGFRCLKKKNCVLVSKVALPLKGLNVNFKHIHFFRINIVSITMYKHITHFSNK